MKRRDLLKSIGLGIGVISLSNTKTVTAADPIATNDTDFNCTQCGWCCKNITRRPGLWKEPLTTNQITQVQAEQTKYQQEPGWCPALIFEDGKYWCLPHKLFGKEAKPINCQNFPWGHPEKFCYEYFKDKIDWDKTKMSPDHLHLIVTSKGGDEKKLKFIQE